MKKKTELEKLSETVQNHIFDYNNQIENLNDDIKKLYDIKEKSDEIPEKVFEAKKEITTHTIELVSIIVGFLGILLAIVIVGIDKIGLSKYTEPIILYLGILFVVMFTIFVIYWIKVNYCEKQN